MEEPKAETKYIESTLNESKVYPWRLVWRNIILLSMLHVFAVQGIYFLLTSVKYTTVLWPSDVYITCTNYKLSVRSVYYFGRFRYVLFGVLCLTGVSSAELFMAGMTGLGITAGAHRLWAHRTYKAKLPLRILLGFFNTMALQTCLYEWVRDHRVHHKNTDTDADPHNVTRGFFFSHMGWLLIRKHKNVLTEGKKLDLSDLEADPVVMYQKKIHKIVAPWLCLVIPALIPWKYWGENLYVSWSFCVLRYVLTLHGTWSVNSVAHIWGYKPYDQYIKPAENVFVAFWAFGEGWHNFHHVFPWDYKTGELGNYRTNFTTAFIDLMAKIGWAYDLKSVSAEMLEKRRIRNAKRLKEIEEKEEEEEEGEGREKEKQT